MEFRLGNVAQALKHLEAAYSARPDVEIGAHLGEVLWSTGDRERALQVWRESQRVSPDNETLKDTLTRFGVKL